MEIASNANVILCGFLVWLIIAPRLSAERYGDWFLAYMAALLLSLIASTEIMMVKPVAFFFTIGGVFAFCYVLARSMLMVRIRR